MALQPIVLPHAQSVSDVFALNGGLDLILEEGLDHVCRRHARVAEMVRDSCEKMGLELFAKRREVCAGGLDLRQGPTGHRLEEAEGDGWCESTG